MPASTCPRFICDWLAEIDVAACVEDLDSRGIVFDKHQMDFETLDSKIPKGIMKVLPVDLKRKINFLGETTKRCPLVTGRQIMFPMFSLFNINSQTQGHSMNLSGLLNVALRNDKLKMLIQAWKNVTSHW